MFVDKIKILNVKFVDESYLKSLKRRENISGNSKHKKRNSFFSTGTSAALFTIELQGKTLPPLPENSRILTADEMLQLMEEEKSMDVLPLEEAVKILNDHLKGVMVFGDDKVMPHIKKLSPLNVLSDSQQRNLSLRVKKEMFHADETIISKGEHGDCMYIIDSGNVDVVANDTVVASLCPGQCFGERALTIDDKRVATIIGRNDCV